MSQDDTDELECGFQYAQQSFQPTTNFDKKRLTDEQREFCAQNYRLVHYMVERCKSRFYYFDYEELVSEGYGALTQAVREYNPSKGAKFSTFACHVIFNHWRNTSKLNNTRLMPSRKDHDEIKLPLLMSKLPSKYSARYDPEPREELPELNSLLKHLDKRTRKIVVMRWVERRKLTEIADTFGISKQRVRQVLDIARDKLRRCLESYSTWCAEPRKVRIK